MKPITLCVVCFTGCHCASLSGSAPFFDFTDSQKIIDAQSPVLIHIHSQAQFRSLPNNGLAVSFKGSIE